ncbi:uridine kinase [Paenibacillus sp. BR2-3]|uniref:uridine kinase family protein n=1 Tax=Paenibacillus sp. BR2-3 TaxID=3048494 RepID=UPI003977DE9A
MNEPGIREVLEEILRVNRNKKSIIIGIDGCGGAGKSTYAQKLRDHYHGELPASIVHMDDFYLPSNRRGDENDGIGVNFDWRRLLDQVLIPIKNHTDGFYQRYDWNKDALDDWHRVPIGLLVVEGVYALRQELVDYYDYSIWIETDFSTRLARGIERDGENMRHTWEEVWMPAEQKYVELEQPHEKADLIIDGSGR